MRAREFCTLLIFYASVVYTVEKGVAVVNTASDYCVGHRYGGVLVKMFANACMWYLQLKTSLVGGRK